MQSINKMQITIGTVCISKKEGHISKNKDVKIRKNQLKTYV